jgi:hypothetical protein
MIKGGSMKHATKMCIALVCLVAFSISFALPATRTAEGKMLAKIKAADGQPTPYRAASRQNDVLFVEDGSGYAPVVSPDWIWDSVLTQTVGAGNFGWFGPTVNATDDGPDLATMQTYTLVIWHTYDHWDAQALTANDMANIGNYLSVGGKVWLIGQDALYGGVPYIWMDTYFHLAGANEDYTGGKDTMNIHGLNEINCFSMPSICDYVTNPFWCDELFPDTTWGCHGVIEDADSLKVIGIFYPGIGDWQSAFWTVDVRDTTFTDYWSTVLSIDGGMLTAFGVIGVEEINTVTPARLQLNINPDPFVNTTTISFTVPNATDVSLTIYNRIGQHIATLVNEHKQEGSYSVNWNRKDARGLDVPNGVYFVRLTCGDVASTANIVITK